MLTLSLKSPLPLVKGSAHIENLKPNGNSSDQQFSPLKASQRDPTRDLQILSQARCFKHSAQIHTKMRNQTNRLKIKPTKIWVKTTYQKFLKKKTAKIITNLTKKKVKNPQQTCCLVVPKMSHHLFDILSIMLQLQFWKCFDETI